MSRAGHPRRYCFWAGVALFTSAVLLTMPARAIDGQDQKTLPSPRVASSPFDPWTQLRDIENARAALANKGMQFQLIYFGDLLDNPSGGVRQGATYVGRLGLLIDADLEKILGWSGAAFHASIQQIHGHGLSGNNLDNLLVVSGIEALPATRLFNLWIEQKFASGMVSIRAGQLSTQVAPTQEFFVSQYGSLFVNATFGWPAITAINLPSGGPTYPLATPGVRLKISPNDQLTILAAVFNGDPAGPGPDDPQRRDPTGTNFRVNDPPLFISEIDFAYNQGKNAAGLPGTVKIGGWYHFGQFADQRLSVEGLSLADPRSSGMPAQDRGNFGIYAIVDQMLWRVPGSTDQGLGVFARASVSPSDRNLISAYFDGGATYKGLFQGRENDTLGVGFGFANISSQARALDRDAVSFSGIDSPIRDYEAVVEVTYQTQITPNWMLQPVFQYIIHPGGHIPNPVSISSSSPIPNAAVFGLRAMVKY
jgi:porin